MTYYGEYQYEYERYVAFGHEITVYWVGKIMLEDWQIQAVRWTAPILFY